MKNSKVELKKSDKITLSNGVELIVDYSGTDGSGCHCCDNNICDCYFSRYHAKFCEKNYCDKRDGWIDFGPNLVFVPVDETSRISIYTRAETDTLPDDIDIVSINNNETNENRYKLKRIY